MTDQKRKIALRVGVGMVAVVLIVLVIHASISAQTLPERAREAAEAGGDYLLRHESDEGKFDYRYDPVNDKNIKGYNILRHAGTIYAMMELYGKTEDKRLKEGAEHAIDFLKSNMDQCPPPDESLMCLYDKEKAKLGGNALAILALLEYGQQTGDNRYLEEAKGLADWILALLSPEGQFKPHVRKKNGSNDHHLSEYYPGEAVYALAKLYEHTQIEKYQEAAERAALWLIEVRDKKDTVRTIAHDHWLLYGLNALHTINPDERYLTHAELITDGIIRIQHNDPQNPEWIGGYYNPPRSTPTATRSEGLAAAHEMFVRANEQTYAKQAFEAIEKGIAFQLRTFIDEDTAEKYLNPSMAYGGFKSSLEDAEIRIDYVQHNISAMLGYGAL